MQEKIVFLVIEENQFKILLFYIAESLALH